VPNFANDITIPEDLIEEIARIYGITIFKRPSTITINTRDRQIQHLWENRVKDPKILIESYIPYGIKNTY
jgi:phenylalanyl-tRNA synthetase beta subunit